MKKTVYAIIGSAIFILVYLFVITQMSGIGTNSGTTPNTSGVGGDIVIGVGESVGVDVVRPRWYGTIVETHYSSSTVSKLCLFNVFCIPNQIGSVEMIWIHLSVAFVITFIIVLCIFIDITERGSKVKTQ